MERAVPSALAWARAIGFGTSRSTLVLIRAISERKQINQEMPRCNGFTCRAEVPRLRDVGGTISIAPTRSFLAISKRMRVLVLIVIIGVLISLGWSKPFKERYAEAKATITSELNKLGKKPQKNHDSSGKRH